MIKLQVIGNLGKDCTTNTVVGKNVINFNVAHTESYKDSKGDKVQKTTWVECAYWNESKISQYLTKGTQVYVEGTPEVRTYAKTDGTGGVSLSLRVFSVQLLGSPTGNTQPTRSAAPVANNAKEHVIKPEDITEPIDDLPF